MYNQPLWFGRRLKRGQAQLFGLPLASLRWTVLDTQSSCRNPHWLSQRLQEVLWRPSLAKNWVLGDLEPLGLSLPKVTWLQVHVCSKIPNTPNSLQHFSIGSWKAERLFLILIFIITGPDDVKWRVAWSSSTFTCISRRKDRVTTKCNMQNL